MTAQVMARPLTATVHSAPLMRRYRMALYLDQLRQGMMPETHGTALSATRTMRGYIIGVPRRLGQHVFALEGMIGETVAIFMRWDDTWGQADCDLDLLLFKSQAGCQTEDIRWLEETSPRRMVA